MRRREPADIAMASDMEVRQHVGARWRGGGAALVSRADTEVGWGLPGYLASTSTTREEEGGGQVRRGEVEVSTRLLYGYRKVDNGMNFERGVRLGLVVGSRAMVVYANLKHWMFTWKKIFGKIYRSPEYRLS